jgi:hypothetical protein
VAFQNHTYGTHGTDLETVIVMCCAACEKVTIQPGDTLDLISRLRMCHLTSLKRPTPASTPRSCGLGRRSTCAAEVAATTGGAEPQAGLGHGCWVCKCDAVLPTGAGCCERCPAYSPGRLCCVSRCFVDSWSKTWYIIQAGAACLNDVGMEFCAGCVTAVASHNRLVETRDMSGAHAKRLNSANPQLTVNQHCCH